MKELLEKINETLEIIRTYTKDEYRVGIILGTEIGRASCRERV